MAKTKAVGAKKPAASPAPVVNLAIPAWDFGPCSQAGRARVHKLIDECKIEEKWAVLMAPCYWGEWTADGCEAWCAFDQRAGSPKFVARFGVVEHDGGPPHVALRVDEVDGAAIHATVFTARLLDHPTYPAGPVTGKDIVTLLRQVYARLDRAKLVK